MAHLGFGNMQNELLLSPNEPILDLNELIWLTCDFGFKRYGWNQGFLLNNIEIPGFGCDNYFKNPPEATAPHSVLLQDGPQA